MLVLSKDGTQLMLTTEEPLEKDKDLSSESYISKWSEFTLCGAKRCAYDYGIAELNKIYAIYKNDLASENIDSMNNIGDELALLNPYQDQSRYLYQSPENYIDGNALEEQGTLRITGDSYGYRGDDAIDKNSSLYKVLFEGVNIYYYYWLASRAVHVYSDFCYWGLGDVGWQESVMLSYTTPVYENGCLLFRWEIRAIDVMGFDL